MNNMKNLKKKHDSVLSVYYDGLCQICSREIDHYRKIEGANEIRFVDITDEKFNPSAEGLNAKAVHKMMHVKLADGTILTAVDAFREIWKVLPAYRQLYKITGLSILRPLLDLGYHTFARLRPWLPKRSSNCESSPYYEIGKKPGLM